MEIFIYILSLIFILGGVLPFISHQHWMFRVWEFGRIQLTVLLLLNLILGFQFIENRNGLFWGIHSIEAALIVYNLIILIPYTTLYKRNKYSGISRHSLSVSIISVNVYQFNENYGKLIDLVNDTDPDILLTMETNKEWEDAIQVLEKDFPYYKKVALENTYGIHFYSKLPASDIKVNYFVADDLPSIEASLKTSDGTKFTFFGVHPPPPSPTEEETSKERDGELLCIAKKVKATKGPVIVVGDFNNVAWAKSSILFRKTSELIDPRIGRGFVSTFHAKYKLLRFPIDLLFHTTDIFIEEFKTLRNIDSDHLPLFCKFFINHSEEVQEEEVEILEPEEKEEVEEMIREGIEEEGDRDEVVEKD
ncbi:endonuclease/exonuclease/phosphatase family protein [Christiangramia aquimixticola]|uniref:endonuclease/exonuclease/phosphatase family protein n=1 Tax=Christiangramia aquimixticola TaxID=1697558 RepID=UPI003AA83366